MAAQVGAAGNRKQVAALLFMTSAMMTLDAYSTFMSSPWTGENFGADEEKTRSAKEYLCHAAGFATAFAVASSIMAESPMPLVGSLASNGYLVWLYLRAFRRGAVAGSAGWQK